VGDERHHQAAEAQRTLVAVEEHHAPRAGWKLEQHGEGIEPAEATDAHVEPVDGVHGATRRVGPQRLHDPCTCAARIRGTDVVRPKIVPSSLVVQADGWEHIKPFLSRELRPSHLAILESDPVLALALGINRLDCGLKLRPRAVDEQPPYFQPASHFHAAGGSG